MEVDAAFTRTVARLLLASPHPCVDRSRLRALVPSGSAIPLSAERRERRVARGNRSGWSQGRSGSRWLSLALRDFERAGLIRRLGTTHVQVLDRVGLASIEEPESG